MRQIVWKWKILIRFDLVSRREDELLQVRNFGDTTLTEVRDRLEQIGLRLGMKVLQSTGV